MDDPLHPIVSVQISSTIIAQGPTQDEADLAATKAALDEAVGVINRLRELNMTAQDENGHRWANSDLAEQEIIAFLAKHGSQT